MIGLTLGPIIASLWLSFTNFDLLTKPRWIGIQNYTHMFTSDPDFVKSLKVTITYVVVGVPIEIAFALFLAMLLKAGTPGTRIYRAVYYIPSLLGGSVAVAILWQQIFGASGLINHGLGLIGIHTKTSWVSTPDTALWTLIVLYVWQFGSPMLIFLAGLKQIPTELYEAARTDGANRFQQFRLITFPLLTPFIFFNLVLQIINAFHSFTQAYIVSDGTGGPSGSLMFYTLYIYQQGFTNFHMGYASALAWVLLAIIAFLTAIAFKLSKYWVFNPDEGGVKA